MKKFQFRLESLLKYRQYLEHKMKLEVASVVAQVENVRREIKNLKNEQKKTQEKLSSLTEKGMDANLTNDDLLELYELRKKWKRDYRQKRKARSEYKGQEKSNDDETENEDILHEDYRASLLNELKSLPPVGFERICQRVLRESGFEQVNVTGTSGDGGIDGIGILQVNPFVSFKVLFQCKRYQGSVGSSVVRDFRGAMMGRADKGITMTTGTFTRDAK